MVESRVPGDNPGDTASRAIVGAVSGHVSLAGGRSTQVLSRAQRPRMHHGLAAQSTCKSRSVVSRLAHGVGLMCIPINEVTVSPFIETQRRRSHRYCG